MSDSTELVSQAQAGGLAAFLEPNNAFTGMGGEYNVTGDIFQFSGNTGQFTYKQEAIEHGSQLVFNVFEMKKGWICWKAKKPIDKVVVAVKDNVPTPARNTLTEHGPFEKEGEGWFEFISVPVCDLEGELPEMELGLSSKGGTSALARLAVEFGQKARLNLDDQRRFKMPVVEIGAQSFESKKAVGVKYAPTFKLVGWISLDEMDAIAAQRAANQGEKAQEEEVAPPPDPKPAPAATAKPIGFQANRAGKRV